MQIANSKPIKNEENRKAGAVDRDMGVKMEVIRERRMCPAVIFAASRKDKVIGRRVILIHSISTRNGLSHPGAPSGRKWAVEDLRSKEKEEIIMVSQRGRPRDKVRARCEEEENE